MAGCLLKHSLLRDEERLVFSIFPKYQRKKRSFYDAIMIMNAHGMALRLSSRRKSTSAFWQSAISLLMGLSDV
jgi:hypothetical protein